MRNANWWENPGLLGLLIVLSAVPLFLPHTPPLVDVPAHIARYRIELDLDSSSELQRFFTFKWALIGNLGVDLLVIPLEPLFGLENAVKLIVLLIPPVTAIGILWTAREIHGRIPPTALFALPFVYGFPFNFGFINFALSMALALLAYALWLRLGRSGRLRTRTAIFIPISCVIWIVHAFGWGVLGLLVFSTELVRNRCLGRTWTRAALAAVLQSAILAVPILFMAIWRSGSTAGGTTTAFFAIGLKIYVLAAALRDRWLPWDSFSVAVAIIVVVAPAFEKNLQFSRRLFLPALVLAIFFIILPGKLFGSAYADARLVPFMLIVLLVAIRFSTEVGHKTMSRIAALGVAFAILRFAGNTASFAIADRDAQRQLAALDHIPRGAAVFFLASDYTGEKWNMQRHTHLGSFVITRRLGFSNDQWQLPGAQLLRVNYDAAGDFESDPSEIAHPKSIIAQVPANRPERKALMRSTEAALREFPRDAFDFVWMIRPPDFDFRTPPGLTLVWRDGDSVLYKVDHQRPRSGR